MIYSKKKKPRKPCLIAAVLAAFIFVGAAYADNSAKKSELISLGMKPELAQRLGEDSHIQSNNTPIKMYDSAGTSTSILTIDSSDETYLYSSSGDGIHLDVGADAQRILNFTAASDTALVLTFGDGTANQDFNITGTADTDGLFISAGTPEGPAHGATLELYGLTDNTYPGEMIIFGGAVSTGHISLRNGHASSTVRIENAASTPVATFNNSGYLTTPKVIMATNGEYVVMAPYIPTTAATPAIGTNSCYPGACPVPTAAANNAVLIGANATPVAGEQFYISNTNGTNLIRAKAAGAATINGSVAGGYIGLAANTSMHCYYVTASDLRCDSYSGGAIPTPAGP